MTNFGAIIIGDKILCRKRQDGHFVRTNNLTILTHDSSMNEAKTNKASGFQVERKKHDMCRKIHFLKHMPCDVIRKQGFLYISWVT